MFYTYAHYRADDNRIFYIGKGSGERYRKNNNRNRHWHRIVNKHGIRHEILSRWDTEKEALLHEKFLIGLFRELGYQLANITDGGKENAGPRHTEKSKELLRKAHTGRKFSPERCEGMSKARKGIQFSAEWRKNLSIARTGMKVPKACSPVYCITLDLHFNSVSLASCLLGLDRSHIVKVCRGKLAHIGGYKFQYD